jgi:phosphoribosylaminoimidazolecarboxamide formyltransferase/IMP cyclohydrolase
MHHIQNALISVYSKEKIEIIAAELQKLHVNIYSTGGTFDYLQQIGVKAIAVESVTGYPSIFGGRVKTLHPAVMGGILYRRAHEADVAEAKKYNIPPVDLVIVDLYPFEETIACTSDEAEIIEKIDIGGISLIRAAAKNYADVLCVPSKRYYEELMDLLQTGKGSTTIEQRKRFAKYCFETSADYDRHIADYFVGDMPLRYGENPHQKAVYHGNFNDCFEQLHGKEISYNNLLDIDAAVALIADFEPHTFAIIKHNNACGVATDHWLAKAWENALAADPVSAFGGVLICNSKVDVATAEKINELFFEILIAPRFEIKALAILQSRKNRILLRQKPFILPKRQSRSLLSGSVEQDRDCFVEQLESLVYPTLAHPSASQMRDLLYANRLVKHTKSNAIVLVKNNRLLASGMGQTSRVDALKHAIAKAKEFTMDLNGSVMASDAFFPFKDCVEIAAKEGIVAIIQPGGSVRDAESVEACDKTGLAMVFTGIRHFKH